MPVFFIQSRQITNNTVTIDHPLRFHLAKSLRVRKGEHIWVGDEQRVRYRLRIDRLDAQAIQASILETVHGPPPPPASVVLAQAVLKGDRMNWVIQKATELGVATIVPLLTTRVIVRPPAHRIRTIQARWQRIAMEATEQSEQWVAPCVTEPMSLPALFEYVRDATLRCALVARGATHSLRGLALDHTFHGIIVLAVGPEGGWTTEEGLVFQERQFYAASLGDAILRSETAPLAALTILQHRLGNLG